MKKFYNNTKISGAFSKALRVVALLCVLLGVSTSAWGEAIQNNWKIGFNTGGSDVWENVNNNDTKDFGSLTSAPKVIGLNTWVNKENGNVCDGNKLTIGGVTYGSEKTINVNVENWDDPVALYAPVNETLPNSAGSHTVYFTFKVNVGSNCGGVINKTFKVTYSIAGGGGSSTTYYLCGGFNNWNETSTPFSNGSCTVSLESGQTYEFKVKDADNWYGNTGTITETITGWTFSSGTGNCKITTAAAGNYVFTWHEDTKKLDVTYPTSGGGGTGGSDCATTGKFYLTGNPVGGWDGYWTELQPTEDGKGHYYILAQKSGGFKMSNTTNYNDSWWGDIKVSNDCSTITYNGDGSNAELKTANVYIKYNPCTNYIWTEDVNCSQAPVFTVPSTITLGFGESINLNNICSSTSDATITYSITSGTTSVSLNGSTLTAKNVAGTATIKASQPLKSPYCSGSTQITIVVEEKSIVILAEDATKDNKDNWTLSAYLEKTDCKTIKEYGFFLCGTETDGGCVPTSSNHSINIKKEGNLLKGTHFTGVVNASDIVSEWYGYRSYVKFSDDTYKLSSETRYFTNCTTVFGDTIYVTIDNSLTANNKCDFRFKSFDDAWATIKTYKDICTAESVKYGDLTQDRITLIKPVVMQVVPTGTNYKGAEKVGLSGGDKRDEKALFFRNINMKGGQPLIVRSIDKSATRATLEHIAIRRSKNITFDYINIVGANKTADGADNAIDIDSGEGDGNWEGFPTDWNCVPNGGISDANINIKNCFIESYGFTCIHVSAYDGILFENNEIKALYDFVNSSSKDNTANWGASAKFLNSRNIKFVRNNFTGQHATSILLQGSQNVLIYNNVFWHENAVQTNVNTVAIIRLVSYGSCSSSNPLQNIGIYYNTMFLKNNTIGDSYYTKFDFFRLGGSKQTGNTSNYHPSSIEFDYNNCYSYDDDVTGKNNTSGDSYYLQSMSENSWCSSFKYNNFWSVYDENNNKTESGFELGAGCSSDNSTYTNVANLVCKTAPEEPGSLVIKGDGLNKGAFVKTDASGLLTTEMQKIDRLGNPRPYDPNSAEGSGEYTVGAYQQSEGSKVSKIIWNGTVSTDWDNRNNWYKPNGQLVTCVDILTENLEVVIPAPQTVKYPVPEGGVEKYPKLPAIADDNDFSTTRTNNWYGEEVSAGKGELSKPTKVANGITMEYGAALIGVEQLAQEGNTERYSQATTELIVPRSKWILVGPIIRPFDYNGKARDMVSGDYFIEKQEPHVWMHEAEMNGNSVAWKNPFPDLDKQLLANNVFAIQIADMYGTGFMLPAEIYNEIFGTSYDGSKPIQYTFTGRFTNEGALPNYTLTPEQPTLLNNSYPANINVETLRTKKGGTVQIYNYTNKSFEPVTTGLIIAQHGFVYTSNAKSLEIPVEAFETTNTEHRSAFETLPEISIKVSNESASASSKVNISVDWLKEDVINYDTDAPKVFNAQETKLPDLYIMRYNEKWAAVRIPSYNEAIPLGIRVSARNQTFVFSLDNMVDISSVILEDRLEGKNYDLSAGETCIVEDLEVGDCEGRFFLNIGEPKEEDPDDTPTDVEEELSSENGISIISKKNGVIVSCSSDIELQTIYINDMSGKTAAFRVSGQYAEIELPVAQGVYTVNVIGDTASKIGKVILK